MFLKLILLQYFIFRISFFLFYLDLLKLSFCVCSCPYLHRTTGDTERKYHLRYYKTGTCIHETDARGHCVKNGLHCAFAHGPHDLRPPVYDIRWPAEQLLSFAFIFLSFSSHKPHNAAFAATSLALDHLQCRISFAPAWLLLFVISDLSFCTNKYQHNNVTYVLWWDILIGFSNILHIIIEIVLIKQRKYIFKVFKVF